MKIDAMTAEISPRLGYFASSSSRRKNHQSKGGGVRGEHGANAKGRSPQVSKSSNIFNNLQLGLKAHPAVGRSALHYFSIIWLPGRVSVFMIWYSSKVAPKCGCKRLGAVINFLMGQTQALASVRVGVVIVVETFCFKVGNKLLR